MILPTTLPVHSGLLLRMFPAYTTFTSVSTNGGLHHHAKGKTCCNNRHIRVSARIHMLWHCPNFRCICPCQRFLVGVPSRAPASMPFPHSRHNRVGVCLRRLANTTSRTAHFFRILFHLFFSHYILLPYIILFETIFSVTVLLLIDCVEIGKSFIFNILLLPHISNTRTQFFLG